MSVLLFVDRVGQEGGVGVGNTRRTLMNRKKVSVTHLFEFKEMLESSLEVILKRE